MRLPSIGEEKNLVTNWRNIEKRREDPAETNLRGNRGKGNKIMRTTMRMRICRTLNMGLQLKTEDRIAIIDIDQRSSSILKNLVN